MIDASILILLSSEADAKSVDEQLEELEKYLKDTETPAPGQPKPSAEQ